MLGRVTNSAIIGYSNSRSTARSREKFQHNTVNLLVSTKDRTKNLILYNTLIMRVGLSIYYFCLIFLLPDQFYCVTADSGLWSSGCV